MALCPLCIGQQRTASTDSSFDYLTFGPNLPEHTSAGASGVFAGQEDEYVAVLDSIGAQVRIYATKESKAGPPPVVRALEVFPPGAYALFPSPAWSSLPRYALLPHHAGRQEQSLA